MTASDRLEGTGQPEQTTKARAEEKRPVGMEEIETTGERHGGLLIRGYHFNEALTTTARCSN